MSATSDAMDALAAAVGKSTAGTASAKTLILEYAKYNLANANNPAAITAAANQITADADDLAATVMANPDPDATD